MTLLNCLFTNHWNIELHKMILHTQNQDLQWTLQAHCFCYPSLKPSFIMMEMPQHDRSWTVSVAIENWIFLKPLWFVKGTPGQHRKISGFVVVFSTPMHAIWVMASMLKAIKLSFKNIQKIIHNCYVSSLYDVQNTIIMTSFTFGQSAMSVFSYDLPKLQFWFLSIFSSPGTLDMNRWIWSEWVLWTIMPYLKEITYGIRILPRLYLNYHAAFLNTQNDVWIV